jgi:hypothetical protein
MNRKNKLEDQKGRVPIVHTRLAPSSTGLILESRELSVSLFADNETVV